ncbi:MAG TPA: hypothetical protein VGF48_06290 [Thermoanaerobaculia bacterium]|jgi:C-terminal processing protease CtpA/Prc
MARGWESKSVESQMEDRQEPSWAREARPSRDDLEQRAKRESLEMSRRRVERELEGARSDTHRIALEHALRHLDDELGRLR